LDIERYARQILLTEVGGKGQAVLGKTKILLIGLGGLGSPAGLYLAAAGVGTLGLLDADVVDKTNLHRQLLHFTPDLGRPKTESASATLADLNPEVNVVSHPVRLTAANARDLLAPYDIVLDGSDNFETRYIVNDAAMALGKTLVSGAALKWEGQLMVARPGQACYRCAFPEPPDPACVQSCAEGGILGPVAGVLGCLMAVEAIKEALRLPQRTANRLLTVDALTLSFRWRPLTPDPACPAVPTIRV
jgi:adenylyltransferase/sulfurtransferase